MLDAAMIDDLLPAELPSPDHWERRYPPRDLPAGALVTRFGPSPTGHLHIGGIYAAMIDRDLADHSGGRYVLRVEDTDQARLVEGATEQLTHTLAHFDLVADEPDSSDTYGPYAQSERSSIYLSYVRELLRQGKAYPCFATKDELQAITAQQQTAKAPTGYYGKWAIWRDASAEAVAERLAAGDPYVIRFRAPGGVPGRVRFTDAIRGDLELDENVNDIVILKSSDQPLRLPTYHLAHAIDDHLMRINLVVRGDEWLSSVPVHLQLFEALGFEPISYAHIAPLLKLDGGNKRKLSKRKDAEASADFYVEAGYPPEAVLYYLRGLANGRLAEMPLPEALSTPLELSQFGVAGPLVDPVKLDDISADHIATLTGEEILDAVCAWAATYDPELATALAGEPDVALRALSIERDGVDNPRKDLRKWSEFRGVYGYFLQSVFSLVTDPGDDRFAGLDPALVTAFTADIAANYRHDGTGDEWFAQIREAAARHGFAANAKEYKKQPDAYPGSIREASQVVRVLLTGSTRSPNLHLVAQALGEPEVLRRLTAVS